MSRISVTEFFRANPLYKKLYHKGDPTKSYRAQTQSYILECKKCKEQIKLSGNSLLMTMCRRCRRRINVLDDGSKELVEPESEEDISRAKAGMARERNVVAVPEAAGPVLYPSEDEESEDEESDDDTPVMTLRAKDQGKKKPAVPNDDDMIDFLKTTAKNTGGERRADEKVKQTAEEAADIDEPVGAIPAKAKKEKKRPSPPKANPVTTTAAACPVTTSATACPEVKERTIKIVELKLGQHFFSNELGMMFVAVE